MTLVATNREIPDIKRTVVADLHTHKSKAGVQNGAVASHIVSLLNLSGISILIFHSFQSESFLLSKYLTNTSDTFWLG